MRRIGRKTDYVPVRKYNETRYGINFDYVPYEDDESIGYWTSKQYFYKPTTEQVREDVIEETIARYVAEGLTPPEREDIDVEPYVID